MDICSLALSTLGATILMMAAKPMASIAAISVSLF